MAAAVVAAIATPTEIAFTKHQGAVFEIVVDAPPPVGPAVDSYPLSEILPGCCGLALTLETVRMDQIRK